VKGDVVCVVIRIGSGRCDAHDGRREGSGDHAIAPAAADRGAKTGAGTADTALAESAAGGAGRADEGQGEQRARSIEGKRALVQT
jgi:hypothetical protein